MYDNKQSIHYCTILPAEQWDFLLEGKFSTHRQKCLCRLMTDAVQAETTYKIKGVEIVLEVGEVAASDVELAEYLGCNRKTVGKLIDSFNRLGMLTTRTNNRTSIHTLHFLTGWYVGGVLITNPHYVRPSATAKGQTGDVRTPHINELTLKNEQSTVPHGSQSQVDDADSIKREAAVLSSSLCLSVASDHPTDEQNHKGNAISSCVTDSGHERLDNADITTKEAQYGTIGSKTDANTDARE